MNRRFSLWPILPIVVAMGIGSLPEARVVQPLIVMLGFVGGLVVLREREAR